MEEREFEIEIEGRKMKLVGSARDIENICLDMAVITSKGVSSYQRDGLDRLSDDAWKVRNVFYNIYKQLEEERKNADKKTSPADPVTIHYDAEGNPSGVRVKTLDEDFVIALEDAENGCEMTWATAVEKYGNVLPTKKQASVICAYLDEIKAAMKEAGGDDLDRWYWTIAECNANDAWFYSGGNGKLSYDDKYNTLSVRPVLAV